MKVLWAFDRVEIIPIAVSAWFRRSYKKLRKIVFASKHLYPNPESQISEHKINDKLFITEQLNTKFFDKNKL